MLGEKKKRTRRSKKFKRWFVNAFKNDNSGLTFTKFCAKHGVLPHTAKGWQAQIAAYNPEDFEDEEDNDDDDDEYDDDDEDGDVEEELDDNLFDNAHKLLSQAVILGGSGASNQDTTTDDANSGAFNQINNHDEVIQGEDDRSSQSSVVPQIKEGNNLSSILSLLFYIDKDTL